MNITPAILTDSFTTFQQQLDAVRDADIEAVQIDVIDGQFADEITVTPLDLTVADFAPLKIDFHFMTEEPLDFFYEVEAVKEYLPVRRMYAQVERMSHQADFLWAVHANDWQAGLALDVFTPLEAIDAEVWPNLQHVLLMAVEAGAQNQAFHPQVLEKVQEIRELVGNKIQILVDGGVNVENAPSILKAGANEVAVGSALWKSPQPAATVAQFLAIS